MSSEHQDCARLNVAWSREAIRALIAAGVKHCIVCPGSRSAPLVLAAAEAGAMLQTHVHFDERGAGFYALGLALGSESPVMIVTTSGTAVANLLPAVMEASLSHVPLLICSADRPPELRDTEANQTMDQVRMFGTHTRWFFDLPCPTAEMPNAEAFIASTMRHAVTCAATGDPGPVHLNFMFREPLVPAASEMPQRQARSELLPSLESESGGGPAALPDVVKRCIAQADRGLLLVGQLSRASERRAVLSLSQALGWPVIADVTSGLRCNVEGLPLVQYSSLLLQDEKLFEALDADTILHVGGRMVSKSLARYLQSRNTRTLIRFQSHPRRSDPSHQVTHRCVGHIASLCRAAMDTEVRVNATWQAAWHTRDKTIADALKPLVGAQGHDEFSLMRHVSKAQPESHDLFLSNSLAIREYDLVGVPLPQGVVAHANRGVSGIDGIVASAAGGAHGRQRPLVLVIGDQSLLHDLNSLSLLRSGPPVTLVVFNNDGGGIFDTLPIAQHGRTFETFFAAPHGLTFEHAPALFGLDYACAETREHFDALLQARLAQSSSGLIEVRTSRVETRERLIELRRLAASLSL